MILALAGLLPGTPLEQLRQLDVSDGVDCLMAAAGRYQQPVDQAGGEVIRGGPELLYGLLGRK